MNDLPPVAAPAPVPTASEVAIDLPAGWEHSVPGGPVALLAWPQAHDRSVRPTIVVTYTSEPDAKSLDRYVDRQLAGLATSVTGYLLHVEIGHTPAPYLDLALAVDHLGVDLTLVQRHLLSFGVSGPWSAVATGAATVADWPDLAASLLGSVRSLRLAR